MQEKKRGGRFSPKNTISEVETGTEETWETELKQAGVGAQLRQGLGGRADIYPLSAEQ